MNLSKIELPSNQKFGFFFTGVFVLGSGYFWFHLSTSTAYTFLAISAFFLFTTLVKADLLLPLNKLWMRFGLLIGMIVRPIVLGIIFFLLFTPIALIMRLLKRDELRLSFRKKNSHWIKRDALQYDSFKNQF